jgi:hypothetical protein
MMKAYSSSDLRGDARSATDARVGETTRCAREADALGTSDALALAVHADTGSDTLAARAFSRRGVLATHRPRRGAVLRTSAVSATPRLSWRRLPARARALGLGPRRDGWQRFRGDARCIRALPDAEERRLVRRASFRLGSLSDAQSPNHAMERTAGSRTI